MNILIDRLPAEIDVDGRYYPIHSDFRNWIRFELLSLDPSVSPEDKLVKLLKLCYVKLPPSLHEAVRAMVAFHAGPESPNDFAEKRDEKAVGFKRRPIYSYEYDADYIYAAFLAQYGLDLRSVELHWWQFKALFKSLNDSNQIVKIMEYRSMDLTKIRDKEQKAFYRKMQRLYRLPDMRSEEERQQELAEGLSVLF